MTVEQAHSRAVNEPYWNASVVQDQRCQCAGIFHVSSAHSYSGVITQCHRTGCGSLPQIKHVHPPLTTPSTPLSHRCVRPNLHATSMPPSPPGDLSDLDRFPSRYCHHLMHLNPPRPLPSLHPVVVQPSTNGQRRMMLVPMPVSACPRNTASWVEHTSLPALPAPWTRVSPGSTTLSDAPDPSRGMVGMILDLRWRGETFSKWRMVCFECYGK